MKTPVPYSVQMLTRYDAYTGKVLSRYYTKEYRRVMATSETDAIHKNYCGPFDSIGRVCRVAGGKAAR